MGRASFWQRWSPILFHVGRWNIRVTVRVPRIAGITLRAVWNERYDRDIRPRIVLETSLWRLNAGVRLGGLWRDEDGEQASLAAAWMQFQTYGIPNLVCRVLGHRPDGYEYGSGVVFCDRCHDQVVTRMSEVRR